MYTKCDRFLNCTYDLVSVILVSVLIKTVLVLVDLQAKYTLQSRVALCVLVNYMSLDCILVFTDFSTSTTLITSFNLKKT